MTTKFDVGDAIIIEGVVEYIHIETTDNEAVYHVRIKGAGSYETYCIRVKEDIMKSVESLSRPKGEWSDESNDSLLCSACGKRVYKPFIGGFPTERTLHYYPNFCAFCGADMRKEEKKNDG